MSGDYFGALIRASGIAAAGGGAAGSARDAVLEIEREEVIPWTARYPAPESERVEPAAAEPMPASQHESTRHHADLAEPAAPSTTISPQRADRPRIAEAARADHTDALLPPSVDDTARASSAAATPQEMIQAALQWVTQGNAAAFRTDAHAARAEAAEPIVQEAAASQRVLQSTESGEETTPPRAVEEAAPALADRASHPPRAARVQPLPEAASAHAGPARARETIDVSIGAIHVRVDAPAAQTLARPAAPAAPATPRPSASVPASHSSRLARRALRRI